MTMQAELWDAEDIAKALGVKIETVWTWKARGDLPPPVRFFGRAPAWDSQEILAWAEAR